MSKQILPEFSVLMPCYNHSSFIERAIQSLFLQTIEGWELIIVNDGSTDDLEYRIQEYIQHERVKYIKNDRNRGLGYCLNRGFEEARGQFIAYLPADDVFFSNHLESLLKVLTYPQVTIACSGLIHGYNENAYRSGASSTIGKVPNCSYQLVQMAHRNTSARWVEREELVTANLDIMFWDKLIEIGKLANTEVISAEWVNHPRQRHKVISEIHGGGITTYKQYYNVDQPLRYIGSGNLIDEYDMIEKLHITKISGIVKPLRILLIGEMGFNPERLLAFEERGHLLFGLWIEASGFLSNTGPFCFGNIKQLSGPDEVETVKPDIIYALLNDSSILLAHQVLLANKRIPFVWHFKESPFFSRQAGLWEKLMDLYQLSDGQIYLNELSKDWICQATGLHNGISFILDGDLPRIEWFTNRTTSLLSDQDGAFHTVVPGRPYGLSADHIRRLALQDIHFHFYGNFQQNIWARWIADARKLAPDHLHMHDNCEPYQWVEEFSQYDAGWLHIFNSENRSELVRFNWDDINYPARIPTLAAAGLPMLFRRSTNGISATQILLEKFEIGILFNSFEELEEKLSDKHYLTKIRYNVWNKRMQFSFDYHVDNLIDFFYHVIESKKYKDVF